MGIEHAVLVVEFAIERPTAVLIVDSAVLIIRILFAIDDFELAEVVVLSEEVIEQKVEEPKRQFLLEVLVDVIDGSVFGFCNVDTVGLLVFCANGLWVLKLWHAALAVEKYRRFVDYSRLDHADIKAIFPTLFHYFFHYLIGCSAFEEAITIKIFNAIESILCFDNVLNVVVEHRVFVGVPLVGLVFKVDGVHVGMV